MSTKPDEYVVSVKIKKKLLKIVDEDREKYNIPRSSWIIQAIVERLERLGYDVK